MVSAIKNLFYCKRFSCKLSVEACIGRQQTQSKEKVKGWRDLPIIREECMNCEQGKKNLTEHGPKDMSPAPLIPEHGVIKAVTKEMQPVPKSPEPPLKKCCMCKAYKPLDKFHENSHEKDGLQTACKECKSKIHKIYRQNKRKTAIRAGQEKGKPIEKKEEKKPRICVKCGNAITGKTTRGMCNKCYMALYHRVTKNNKDIRDYKAGANNLSITIDFTNQKDLLQIIKDEAIEQLRTPENLILFLLKTNTMDRKGDRT